MHCTQKTLLLYEYEGTSISQGYKIVRRKKNELSKNSMKKKIINRRNHSQYKTLSFCIHVKNYKSNDSNESSNALSKLKEEIRN